MAALSLALAGCGDDEKPEEGTDAAASSSPSVDASAEEEAEESATADVPELEVPPAFGEATWGLRFDGVRPRVLVTGSATVVADGETVRAVGPDGEELWSVPAEDDLEGNGMNAGTASYPQLRPVGDDAVAYVSAGTTEGEGLEEAGTGVQAQLLKIADGSEIGTVQLPGDDSGPPEIAEHGLVFSGLEKTTLVKSDGTTQEVEGNLAIGDTVVVSEGTDLAFPGWKASSIAPEGANLSVPEVLSHNGDDLVLLRWSQGTSHQVVLAEVATGKVVARPECEVPGNAPWVSSPSGKLQAAGPLLIEGRKVTCVGGGEGQVEVTIAALTDDGHMFGETRSTSPGEEGGTIAGKYEFVSIPPDGQAERTEVPSGTGHPLGVMEGDVVVNYGEDVDSEQNATLTGNPVK